MIVRKKEEMNTTVKMTKDRRVEKEKEKERGRKKRNGKRVLLETKGTKKKEKNTENEMEKKREMKKRRKVLNMIHQRKGNTLEGCRV